MLGGDQAVRVLCDTVQNEHEDLIVRGRSALMLGKLRDVRAVPPLIRALNAPGFQTPLFAAEALGNIGDPRAIDPLVALAESGKDKTRDAALAALQKLGYSYVPKQPEVQTQSQSETTKTEKPTRTDRESEDGEPVLEEL
jgi:hypothetical protein